jgi:linker histone H1 and H5 family
MGSMFWGGQNQHTIRSEQENSLQPATMATISLIKEAIVALKERTGSSVIAINKYLETEKKVRCAQRKKSRIVCVGVFPFDAKFCINRGTAE